MPFLGDVIGKLMAEVTYARVQADIEAVRVAEVYAENEYLRNFPVPRIRLPDVQIDLAVSYSDDDGVEPNPWPKPEDIASKYSELVQGEMENSNSPLSGRRKRNLGNQLKGAVKDVGTHLGISLNTRSVTDRLTEVAISSLNERELELITHDSRESPREALSRLARDALLKTQPELNRLNVEIVPQKLAENSEGVTRLHLNLTEEGVEWIKVETPGGSADRLIPE